MPEEAYGAFVVELLVGLTDAGIARGKSAHFNKLLDLYCRVTMCKTLHVPSIMSRFRRADLPGTGSTRKWGKGRSSGRDACHPPCASCSVRRTE